MTSVSVNSERREHAGINASFENASGNNDTQVISKVNDETRHSITEEVSELSVPETHFDRQPHTHHMVKGNGDRQSQTHHSERMSERYPCLEDLNRKFETMDLKALSVLATFVQYRNHSEHEFGC